MERGLTAGGGCGLGRGGQGGKYRDNCNKITVKKFRKEFYNSDLELKNKRKCLLVAFSLKTH